MAKVIFNIEEDYDFKLIGISCHSKNYQLCGSLNKALFIDLIRIDDLEIKKKGELSSYSFYEFIDENNHIEYYLISNLGNNGYLIAEQKKVDFYLMTKGSTNTNQIQEIICTINSLSLVLTSFIIDPSQLKSKRNLLF